MENGVLTISGEKRYQNDGREGDFRLVERRYGRFQRAFRLPPNVVQDDVSARCENGLLMVTLPKTEEARPRRISIQAGEGGRQIASESAS